MTHTYFTLDDSCRNNINKASQARAHHIFSILNDVQLVDQLYQLRSQWSLSSALVEAWTQLSDVLQSMEDYINHQQGDPLLFKPTLQRIFQTISGPHLETPYTKNIPTFGFPPDLFYEKIAQRIVQSGYNRSLRYLHHYSLVDDCDDFSMVRTSVGDARDHLALATALFEGRFLDVPFLIQMDTLSRDYIPYDIWHFIHSEAFTHLKSIHEGELLSAHLDPLLPLLLLEGDFNYDCSHLRPLYFTMRPGSD